MVYFECQKCNETLKKPKVAKHLVMCCSSYVTCIDCNKVFDWQEFESHTSCVSEAKKYQGKLYDEGKEKTGNKGQDKQDAWLGAVEEAIETCEVTPEIKTLLQGLVGMQNIPRKFKPFANFVKNSLKIWDDRRINAIWDVVNKASDKIKAQKAEAQAAREAAIAEKKEATPAKAAVAPADDESDADAEAAPAAPPKKEADPAPTKSGKSAAEKKEAREKGENSAKAVKKATRPYRWAGWKRALDEELKSSGGQMKLAKLQNAMVARYRAEEEEETSDEVVASCALANIPKTYLSKEDVFVRLPVEDESA